MGARLYVGVGNIVAGSTQPCVIDVYQRHGEAWARLRSDEPVENAWLDRFCALLPAGAAVLEIGCGSGLPIGGELIRRGFAVTGVDGAPTMLSLFRRNLPGTPACLMDMRQLALVGASQGYLPGTAFFISHPTISARYSSGSRPMPPRRPR